jgi:hypothetical protein
LTRRQHGGRESDEELKMFGLFNRKRPEQTSNRPSEAVPGILSAYGELLTQHPSAMMDASWLPVNKKAMVEAFKIAWLNAKSSEARNWLEVGWALLPNFQEGIGNVPVTPETPPDLPLEETTARLDKYIMWAKLADAEGAIMQRSPRLIYLLCLKKGLREALPYAARRKNVAALVLHY